MSQNRHIDSASALLWKPAFMAMMVEWLAFFYIVVSTWIGNRNA